jgi:thiamine-phosphate pyrophosphorylase
MQRHAPLAASSSAGHLACASCTRFSPNTRCPAAIRGAMASAGWVLEMAISSMSVGSRRAIVAALAILSRTSCRAWAGSVMARCYSGWMAKRHALPDIWMISDARNDARIEQALRACRAAAGLMFRHYHLAAARRARFDSAGQHGARAHGHLVIALAGSAARGAALEGGRGLWSACGSARGGPALLRLVTAHSLREMAQAHQARADAILLSPVFATRSHPGAQTLGPVRFRLLARHAPDPGDRAGRHGPARRARAEMDKLAAIDGRARARKSGNRFFAAR